jgi:UDP-3-O-[3-hydroxymyristoyl] N-acetylglucosamine deacetylase/3-hydroxyacyl-[acyl-carrier-protein] dehydratase
MYFYCLCKLILHYKILFLFKTNLAKLIGNQRNNQIMRQRSLSKPAAISGFGLHTNKPVHVDILPAEENTGINFFRTDRTNTLPIPADWKNVCSTQRATSLSAHDHNVRTVEHLLAAIFGSGISNLHIELDAEELPGLDGSSRMYSEVLDAGGVMDQFEERPVFEIGRKYEFGDLQKKSFIRISPYDGFRVTYSLNFDERIRQSYDYEFSHESFRNEISGARTFCLLSEVEPMMKTGLISGINPNVGFVVIDDAAKLDSLTEIMKMDARPYVHHLSDVSVASIEKPRFENEMARHKILDILGDFALSGKYILGHIEAYGTGHTENIALLKAIFGAH